MADDILVMYGGKAVEQGPVRDVFYSPEHPYTWGLLASIPRLDSPRGEQLKPIQGRPPSLINLPTGCSFHPRCPYVRPAHTKVEPLLEAVPNRPGHHVACLLEHETRQKLRAEAGVAK